MNSTGISPKVAGMSKEELISDLINCITGWHYVYTLEIRDYPGTCWTVRNGTIMVGEPYKIDKSDLYGHTVRVFDPTIQTQDTSVIMSEFMHHFPGVKIRVETQVIDDAVEPAERMEISVWDDGERQSYIGVEPEKYGYAMCRALLSARDALTGYEW